MSTKSTDKRSDPETLGSEQERFSLNRNEGNLIVDRMNVVCIELGDASHQAPRGDDGIEPCRLAKIQEHEGSLSNEKKDFGSLEDDGDEGDDNGGGSDGGGGDDDLDFHSEKQSKGKLLGMAESNENMSFWINDDDEDYEYDSDEEDEEEQNNMDSPPTKQEPKKEHSCEAMAYCSKTDFGDWVADLDWERESSLLTEFSTSPAPLDSSATCNHLKDKTGEDGEGEGEGEDDHDEDDNSSSCVRVHNHYGNANIAVAPTADTAPSISSVDSRAWDTLSAMTNLMTVEQKEPLPPPAAISNVAVAPLKRIPTSSDDRATDEQWSLGSTSDDDGLLPSRNDEGMCPSEAWQIIVNLPIVDNLRKKVLDSVAPAASLKSIDGEDNDGSFGTTMVSAAGGVASARQVSSISGSVAAAASSFATCEEATTSSSCTRPWLMYMSSTNSDDEDASSGASRQHQRKGKNPHAGDEHEQNHEQYYKHNNDDTTVSNNATSTITSSSTAAVTMGTATPTTRLSNEEQRSVNSSSRHLLDAVRDCCAAVDAGFVSCEAVLVLVATELLTAHMELPDTFSVQMDRQEIFNLMTSRCSHCSLS